MSDTVTRLKRHVRISGLAIVLLGGTAVASTMLAPISGAVIAPGSVVVESNLRRVQHPTGGVVGRLFVREGQQVASGEVVARLDDTTTRANLAIVVNELHALSARKARLEAERDGRGTLEVPPEIAERAATDPAVAAVLRGEQQLLTARRATRQGQKAQLRERIEQLKEEVQGASLQLASFASQREIAALELSDLEGLLERNLVQRPRVTQIRREVARLDGSLGELTSRRAQSRGRISEIELQILQIDTDHLAEISRELREVETKVTELSERRIAAEDLLARIDIKAPIEGQVHQLAVHTVGGVVGPGETMMLIVPQQDKLIVEARLDPTNIDEVRIGQPTRVRFSAFNFSTTPELAGTVIRVSGDLSRDQVTGMVYYVVGVRVEQSEIDRLRGLQLTPGMPAEVYFTTQERTIGSFLAKPILDHMSRSLRES